jgi:phenylalanyl-tRNA synthetase beta chain
MDKLNQVTGNKLDPVRVRSILESLEIQILSEVNGLFQLMVPAYRIDVRREVDVIEDILRIYGYNKVVFNQTMRFSISPSVKPDRHRMQELISDQLTACGFYELMNNSLTSSAYYEGLTSLPDSHVLNC